MTEGTADTTTRTTAARRRVVAGVAALVLTGAGAVATAPAASAYPYGCSQYKGGTLTYGQCAGGTGTFSVWAQCRSTIWPHYYHWAQSAWVRPGSTAWAFCPIGDLVVQSGLSLRN